MVKYIRTSFKNSAIVCAGRTQSFFFWRTFLQVCILKCVCALGGRVSFCGRWAVIILPLLLPTEAERDNHNSLFICASFLCSKLSRSHHEIGIYIADVINGHLVVRECVCLAVLPVLSLSTTCQWEFYLLLFTWCCAYMLARQAEFFFGGSLDEDWLHRKHFTLCCISAAKWFPIGHLSLPIYGDVCFPVEHVGLKFAGGSGLINLPSFLTSLLPFRWNCMYSSMEAICTRSKSSSVHECVAGWRLYWQTEYQRKGGEKGKDSRWLLSY